jgi:uncharacterized zinc-type alcohol dehydrogenase-like protein
MIGGIGMALMERSVVEARNGRISNAHFAGYAVPVHAATPPVMDVIFVEEHDPHVNPLGVKGVGEIAAVRPALARGPRPRACSAPAVRGRHQLVAAQAAQRRSGEPGRCGRPGRADTVLVQHEVNPYVSLLDVDGALVMVGYFGPLPDAATTPLLFGRRTIMGTPGGGLAETQELLDFCAKKNILPECEMIRMDQINEAFERMEKSDVRYRFVIDMRTLEG